jgi:hypothetical protein
LPADVVQAGVAGAQAAVIALGGSGTAANSRKGGVTSATVAFFGAVSVAMAGVVFQVDAAMTGAGHNRRRPVWTCAGVALGLDNIGLVSSGITAKLGANIRQDGPVIGQFG